MKIKRPLINPTPAQVEKQIRNIEKQEEQPVPAYKYQRKRNQEQLPLNKETKSEYIAQLWGSLRSRLRRRNDFLEISTLWKYPALPFFIVSYISNMLLFVIGILFNYSRIPPKVPFFYDAIEKDWIQYDKFILFVFPIFITVLCFIQFQLILTIFLRDKRLAITIAWLMAFVNLLLFITFSQIYFLIT